MKQLLTLFSALMLLFALSACNITITVDPFIDAEPVTANDNPNQPLADASVAASSADFYKVSVPTGLSGDLIYFELETSDDMKLTVYDANKVAVRASNSIDFFTSAGNLAVSSPAIDAQGIGVLLTCRGPCVILEKGSGTIYLKVESMSGVAEYSLYAYGEEWQDTTEPANNNKDSAPLINDQTAGALETVRDEDYYQSATNVVTVLVTSENDALNIKYDVFTETGDFLATRSAGESYTTPESRPAEQLIAKVYSGNNRAASPAHSNYSIEFSLEVIPVKYNPDR